MTSEPILTARRRKIAYAVFDAAGTALAAAEAGTVATGHHCPPLTAALAVYAVLSARVHGVARRNV